MAKIGKGVEGFDGFEGVTGAGTDSVGLVDPPLLDSTGMVVPESVGFGTTGTPGVTSAGFGEVVYVSGAASVRGSA